MEYIHREDIQIARRFSWAVEWELNQKDFNPYSMVSKAERLLLEYYIFLGLSREEVSSHFVEMMRGWLKRTEEINSYCNKPFVKEHHE